MTWNNLTLLAETIQSAAASTVDILVTLPARTGKHVIYSIWQRSDSPEAFYSASDVDFGDETTATDPEGQPPADFILKENCPNPFNTSSSIGYQLKKGGFVTLKVYDIYGQEVSTLVNGFKTPGAYEVVFNSENLNSGIYLYTLKAGEITVSRRMVLQR